MAKITDVEAHEILDSRGKETLEVKVTTDDGLLAVDSVPSGTSTGSFEALAIEPKIALNHVNTIIKPKLIGLDPANQQEIDKILIDLDETEEKKNLGANAMLGVSLATCRAGAMSKKMPLFWHLNQLYEKTFGETVEPKTPTPMMVMVEGGKHGQNNLCIQEFSIISDYENGKKVWQSVKDILESRNLSTKMGLEGGFTPDLEYDEDAIDLLLEAIKGCGLKIGEDVNIGLDVAANHCQISVDDILTLMNRYPIYLIEDPASESDWHHWAQLKLELDQLKKPYLLVGDDLFVTSKGRLQKGINNFVANAIIIKVNQTGTISETLSVIAMAKKAGYRHILSHRSGETMDTFIADLAVATAADMIKAGAPFASEREIKYKRLLEIASEI